MAAPTPPTIGPADPRPVTGRCRGHPRPASPGRTIAVPWSRGKRARCPCACRPSSAFRPFPRGHLAGPLPSPP